MGYYTQYELMWETKDEEDSSKIERFFLDLTRIDEYSDNYWAETRTFENKTQMQCLSFYAKWYYCDEDMYKLSKQFPDVDFYLTGDGEEPLDYWVEHWKDGRFEAQMAEIPPFTGVMEEYLFSNRKQFNDDLVAAIRNYARKD